MKTLTDSIDLGAERAKREAGTNHRQPLWLEIAVESAVYSLLAAGIIATFATIA